MPGTRVVAVAETCQKLSALKFCHDKTVVQYNIVKCASLTKIARSLQKPFKVFFYDNAEVEGDENLVANHLLKRIEFLEDSTGYRYQLGFIRDREKREVDFVITKEKKLETLIEVKFSDSEISKNLLFFAERLKPTRAIQIVATTKKTFKKNNLELQKATESNFLTSLTD